MEHVDVGFGSRAVFEAPARVAGFHDMPAISSKLARMPYSLSSLIASEISWRSIRRFSLCGRNRHRFMENSSARSGRLN
jgi:hypothetical protein